MVIQETHNHGSNLEATVAMQHSILSLIPQHPKTILKDQEAKIRVLRLVEFFLGEIIISIQAFYVDKNITLFDAHVGDTLCQIRAYRVLSEVENISVQRKVTQNTLRHFEIIYERVRGYVNNFETLKNNKGSKYNETLDSHEQIYDFLLKYQLLFKIPKDLLLLVKERFLTFFQIKSDYGVSIAINYRKIINTLNISHNAAMTIPRKFQKEIAKESCDFVVNLLHKLPNLKKLKFALKLLQKTDKYNRKILPGYEATRVLIESILYQKQYLLFIVHRSSFNETDGLQLLFISNGDGSGFNYCKQVNSDLFGKPCLVIRGIVGYQDANLVESQDNYIERFREFGVKNIILCNMANHPQFSAKEFENIANNPYPQFIVNIQSEINRLIPLGFNKKIQDLKKIIATAMELENELLHMQELGRESGCCIDNPSLFFAKHIYCDVIRNPGRVSNIFDKMFSNKTELAGIY